MACFTGMLIFKLLVLFWFASELDFEYQCDNILDRNWGYHGAKVPTKWSDADA